MTTLALQGCPIRKTSEDRSMKGYLTESRHDDGPPQSDDNAARDADLRSETDRIGRIGQCIKDFGNGGSHLFGTAPLVSKPDCRLSMCSRFSHACSHAPHLASYLKHLQLLGALAGPAPMETHCIGTPTGSSQGMSALVVGLSVNVTLHIACVDELLFCSVWRTNAHMEMAHTVPQWFGQFGQAAAVHTAACI